jgi:hypothetical protein
MKRFALLLLSLTLGVAACGGSDAGSGGTPQPSAGRPKSTALLTIVSPTAGQTVPTSGITVKLSLEKAKIVEAAQTRLRPDEGHVHLMVDGKTITLFAGLEVATGPLTAGPHLIQV